VETEQVRPNVAVEMVSRVQLRAVFAGLMVAFGSLAILLGLSWAIGLSVFRPTAANARGVAVGAAIFSALALWVSAFLGAATAATVGRSTERKDGLLHGLVVWGALASLLGIGLLRMFSGLVNNLVRFGITMAAQSGPMGPEFGPRQAQAAVAQLAGFAGMVTWLYWVGVAGGLAAALIGGLRGARFESGVPRPARARREPAAPISPTIPQPT
jgi:hypothetical protein